MFIISTKKIFEQDHLTMHASLPSLEVRYLWRQLVYIDNNPSSTPGGFSISSDNAYPYR